MLYFSKWKIILISVICAFGILLAFPNVLPASFLGQLPAWLPHNTVKLGLDLQGGVHLLAEVDLSEVVDKRVKTMVDDVRRNLREARIGYNSLAASKRKVSVNIRKPEEKDKALQRLRTLSQPINTSIFGQQAGDDIDVQSGEGSIITLELSEAAISARVDSAIKQSIEILRRRIDELGTTEPTIQRQGRDRILIQVPGLDDPERLKKIIGTTAKMDFRLVDVSSTPQQALESRVPTGSEILYSNEDATLPYLVRKRIMVSGENLVDAQPGFDQRTNEPIVTFRFDSNGAKRFGRVTQRNVGRPFAIILDNKVISAPVIREAILGGTGQISGGFTVGEANDLSILMRAGALPAPLTIVEERTVGPSLGADSIAAGKIASVIGLVAVVGFILVSYGLFGLFANLALFINIALIVGVLSALQATLTLPGIAGIVLTIGMAVDANVLIFERVREELRNGKTPIAAIDTGYSRALATILDANITTLIAAIVLLWIGSGPIRGFAVTLTIGIITSVFTAFTVTRLIIAIWVKKRRPKAVPI